MRPLCCAQRRCLQSLPMSYHRAWPPVRSTAWAVLLAWLCVVATSIAAPVVRAQPPHHHVERLCSGQAAPQWAHSPITQAQGDAAALHHLIDCPLCLPVLALPSTPVQAQGSDALQAAPQPALHTGPGTPRIHWPPARGPPF